jgi:hypothetical protein
MEDPVLQISLKFQRNSTQAYDCTRLMIVQDYLFRKCRRDISKKNRQHNGQKKKYKRTNKDLQNIHINNRSSNTNPTKNRGELRCSGRVTPLVSSNSSCDTDISCKCQFVNIINQIKDIK